MGAIQSGINSTLGLIAAASALYQHSPQGKAQGIERGIKTLDKEEMKIAASQPNIPADADAGERQEMETLHAQESLQKQVAISEQRQKMREEQFSLTGMGKYYDKMQSEGARLGNMQQDLSQAMKANKRSQPKLTASQAKERAMQHMKNAQDEKRNKVSIYGSRGEVLNG